MRQYFISVMAVLTGVFLSGILAMFSFFVFIGIAGASIGKGSTASIVDISRHSILEIDLGCSITERETAKDEFAALFDSDASTLPLNTLLMAIRKAADDKDIDGILLRCNGGVAGMAQSESLIDELDRFRDSGKWIYAYGDSYTQGNYYIASSADSIFVNPVGMIDVHGLSTTIMYFKDLLDKVGVNMQVIKVGTFKSAVEPYMLNQMSEANRLQTSVFLGNMWNIIASKIAERRGISVDALNQIADSACYSQSVDYYLSSGLVDQALYAHELDEKLADITEQETPNLVGVSDYINQRKISGYGIEKGKSKIAILYAVGEITESGGDGIVSDELVPVIMDLSEEDDIDGLIMRVNSGGGSAYASEQIWEALEQFKSKTGKPFYVSMGDYAASGGYYISCGADSIFAQPLTLTGSIGIFGVIPSAQTLLNDKLGVHTSTVATNPGGAFPDLYSDMTPEQRNAMQNYVNRGYELFTSRCAEGRGMPLDSIKAIAEGRVWDGATALRIGLVDRLGSLEDALNAMKDALGVDECSVVEYPDVTFDFWKELKGSFGGIRQSILRSELGDEYMLYDALRRVKTCDPLQCRMEYMILK